jgi:hypothetical protein
MPHWVIDPYKNALSRIFKSNLKQGAVSENGITVF